ncbi:MAG TPA: hypothetical protein PKB10_04485, partial [Tepidisphaeraceae bacterium]|nr:hypothetical protein [Tepidisphaeraceae bacterium]
MLAGLGCSTSFVARVSSTEAMGIVARSELARWGVDLRMLIDDAPAIPAIAVVQVHPQTGARTVFYCVEGYRYLTDDDVANVRFEGARLMLCDGYER